MNYDLLKTHILIFTDGACSGNPGPGGWGLIQVTPEGVVKEQGGRKDNTTNNEMELFAVLQALRNLETDLRPLLICTDSTYVIRGATQWIWGWKKNQWKTAEGGDVSHQKLWSELDRHLSRRGRSQVLWKYCRGHVGTPGNERVDEIAVAYSQKKWVDLYQGPLTGYAIAIHDLPEDEPLPEMKQKTEKKPAHSYLSLVDGQARRHSNWSSCERRVKGRSGARFKKAMSSEEEQAILAEWRVSPASVLQED